MLVLALVVAAAVMLRHRAAPESARLLPEADAYLYVNLKPLRTAGLIGNREVPITEPEYEDFVRETGFQFERDLDDAAVAIHAAPRLMDIEPPRNQPQAFRRFSWIFRGRFDSQRADQYLRHLARSQETYRDVVIHSIPLEGRTVRVALLGVGIAAVSNTDGPQAIRFMVDRYKEMALPFGGPSLVRDYYRDVPFASLIWGIARVSSGTGERTPLALPGGFDLFFPAASVIVGSVRYTTQVQVKAEAFTPSPAQAKQVVEQAGAFLDIFHGLENSMNPSGGDPDVKAFFDSLKVEQNKERAVLTASMSPAFLKKMFSEAPTQVTGSGARPEEPKRPARHGRRKAK